LRPLLFESANGNLEFNFQVQRSPEGPLANSHAREGVEQAIKRFPGPKDRQTIELVKQRSRLWRFCFIATDVHALMGVAIN
jgi:hypothetical protein